MKVYKMNLYSFFHTISAASCGFFFKVSKSATWGLKNFSLLSLKMSIKNVWFFGDCKTVGKDTKDCSKGIQQPKLCSKVEFFHFYYCLLKCLVKVFSLNLRMQIRKKLLILLENFLNC
jgi:hypothetical protein